MGEHPLPGYGSVVSGNRLVRTRLLGGVGAGGERPPATRLAFFPFGGLFVNEILLSFANSYNQNNYFLFNYFVD